MTTHPTHPPRCAVPLALCLWAASLVPVLAQNLEGSYELKGERDDKLPISVRLKVSKRRGGKLSLVRRALVGSNASGRAVWANWRSFQVTQQGSTLNVVFTLSAFAVRTGMTHRLEGRARPVLRRRNTIVGAYRFGPDGQVREVLRNQTRFAPEEAWTSSLALGGPPVRLRLGEPREFPTTGALKLVLPCEGDLHLVGASLRDSAGKTVPASPRVRRQSADALRYEVKAGIYEVRGAPGARVRAILVQEAQLAEATLPWSHTTWYPIHEFDKRGRRNKDALFRAGGPLERFDRAFGLTGDRSSVAWERGDSGRSSHGLDNGHYHRRGTIRESHAERDAAVDLDGDGRIGGKAGEAVRRLDRDKNGRISVAELERGLHSHLREALHRYYDFDRDGIVRLGLDVMASDARDHDTNGDKVLSRDEFGLILEGKGRLGAQAMQLLASWRGVLMAQVRRGQELSAADLKPGAFDFIDNADADGDGRIYFEQRNFVLKRRDGSLQVGSSSGNRGGKFTLDWGTVRERVFPEEDVLWVRRRADGDYRDEMETEWWGHCNGVSIAGILFDEPTEAIRFKGQTFEPDDLKGLLSEFALGEAADFRFGWRDAAEVPRSLPDYTRRFHRTLRGLQPKRTSFMADVELKAHGEPGEVWNYALTGYRLVLVEAAGDDPRLLSVKGEVHHTGGDSVDLAYRLEFGSDSKIRDTSTSRTTWETKSDEGEPLFLRYLIACKPIQGHSRRANPQVSSQRLRELFGGRLPYRAAKAPEVSR